METTEEIKTTAAKAGGEVDHHYRRHKYYRPGITKMRLALMMCAIFYTYNLHRYLGNLKGVIFGFAFPALYIISGYIVLRKSPNTEKRLLGAIKRTAICFGILFAVYFALSLIVDLGGTLALVKSKAFWFNFLALNVCGLPIGFTIWYVQALLYAYIIVYLLYKCKLLKFDIYIAAFCLVVALFTGEFSSVIGFNLLGRTYIGGNFLTRALPYILIGCFIHRKKQVFSKLKSKHYLMMIVAGVLLAGIEYTVLTLTGNSNYLGHTLGMGLVAVAIAVIAFNTNRMKIQTESLRHLTQCELMIPFFVCSPIYYLLTKIFESQDGEVFSQIAAFSGIITVFLSFAILFAYAHFRRMFTKSRRHGG